MINRIKITPRFSANQIIEQDLNKSWAELEVHFFQAGHSLLKYMRHYINSNRKRSGGTGNLAKAIDIKIFSTTGQISWGIGHIPTLQSRAPYWYVLNYGKTISGKRFVPGMGKAVPGYFGGGNRPDSSKKGAGTEHFSYARNTFLIYPGAIRPINYIESSEHMLKVHINTILARFSMGAKF